MNALIAAMAFALGSIVLAMLLDTFLPAGVVWPTVVTMFVVVGSAVIIRVVRQSYFGRGRSR
ncbi:MAG: hypothetical protein WEF86_06820 [Gemmatimonadota bacterium]